MDLDADGDDDILSGSYSRNERPMAGLFQVLWAEKPGQFGKPTPLNGSDGAPLVLPGDASEDADVRRICTRPFAADLDGDKKLDLVVGNFGGTFGLFRGEGAGKFAPAATWLEAGGAPMEVDGHGDPFLVDWDGDGDLDLVSGSVQGGVFLFENTGKKNAPKFAARTTLLQPAGHSDETVLGDAHVTKPASDTRVWVADVDGDKKLDLLIGDNVTLYHAAEGVEARVALQKLHEWKAAVARLAQEHGGSDDYHERWEALQKERDPFVTEQRTGHVWLLRRK